MDKVNFTIPIPISSSGDEKPSSQKLSKKAKKHKKHKNNKVQLDYDDNVLENTEHEPGIAVPAQEVLDSQGKDLKALYYPSDYHDTRRSFSNMSLP